MVGSCWQDPWLSGRFLLKRRHFLLYHMERLSIWLFKYTILFSRELSPTTHTPHISALTLSSTTMSKTWDEYRSTHPVTAIMELSTTHPHKHTQTFICMSRALVVYGAVRKTLLGTRNILLTLFSALRKSVAVVWAWVRLYDAFFGQCISCYFICLDMNTYINRCPFICLDIRIYAGIPQDPA